MKLRHFEALRPICPLCLSERRGEAPLMLSVSARRVADDVIEGVLLCPAPECHREYPIIDGVPLLVPDVRGYIASQIQHLIARDDLSFVVEEMLGEGCGPGSPLDVTRTHLSSYTWDHYAEWDPAEGPGDAGSPRPGAVARALTTSLKLANAVLDGPILDVGCSVGRVAFELARRGGALVLGLDLGYHKLRMASRVLRQGSVRYPRRRVGLLYDWREFAVPLDGERVDFWACDAVHVPVPAGSIGAAVGLNVLDCVYSPLDLLRSMSRVLRPGATLILGSPYDWTPAATTVEAWIGGHSPRGAGGGASDAVLRSLLTPGAHVASVAGLALRAETDNVPWTVRMHERSVVSYRMHVVVAERTP